MMRPGDFFGSVVFEYAEAPLVQAVEGEAGLLAENPVVDDLVAGNISVGAAFHERLRLDVLAPVYFTSLGPEGRMGPAMGDIRMSAMFSLLPPEDVPSGAGGFGAGIIGHLDAPSGNAGRFLGRGRIGGGGKIAATYELPVATFTADAGIEASPGLDLENLVGGPYAVGGAAIGVVVRRKAGVTLEGIVRSPLSASDVAGTAMQAEGVLSVRGRSQKGLGWTVGGSAGLTEGAGTPVFRAFLGFGFGHHEPPQVADVDTEGRMGVRDGCPLQPETKNGWKDDDGCPDKLGAMSVEARFDGRTWPALVDLTGPKGTEQIEIGDEGVVRDAVPGSQWSATAVTTDCLAGEGKATAREGGTALVVELKPVFDARVKVLVLTPAGDPIPEAVAVWRNEKTPHCVPDGVHMVQRGELVQDVGPGTHVLSVTAEGFTSEETQVTTTSKRLQEVIVLLKETRIRVEEKQIVILDKVFFETAKAVIKPESFGLLDEVATTILTNPQVGRVEIAGHTDNQGSESYNQRLSQQRAESVREYLIGKGVDPQRLVAAGYGETRPIDTNRTPTGRERNRRVEFNLLDAEEGTP
ncbi:MAG: OmpA family protein [Alphaproteobacteria bacterium]|nr:OmpA family protein [Alphaproteobacteria bacterium]